YVEQARSGDHICYYSDLSKMNRIIRNGTSRAAWRTQWKKSLLPGGSGSRRLIRVTLEAMRVLITGVCGFVGNTLACGLGESWPDWEIIGLDNLIRSGSELNRATVRRRGIKFVHGDIRSPSDLEMLPRCDWILDAAANPSVLAGVDGKTSSRQLIEHNLAGTVNLLELAREWRSGFLMLSTSRVYSIRELAAIPVEVKGHRFVPRAAREKTRGFGDR